MTDTQPTGGATAGIPGNTRSTIPGNTPPASPPSDPLTQVLELVEQLASALAEQGQRLDQLERPTMPWPTPSEDLAGWVDDWLVPTFRLDTVLQGWAQTPAIVSELAALHAGYLEMTSPKATGWDALAWHQHRASTTDRITTYRQQHMTGPTTSWA